jgi:aspartate aminotransferase-like enzyme
MLCELVGANHVEIMVGSGSLANDVIAGQISLLDSPGVVLANGEFGRRLMDHATRFSLRFQPMETEWGAAFRPEDVQGALDVSPRPEWLWGVHCETSTSILNDLDMLKQMCAARQVKLCMDCISSIGTVPVNLQGVYLASGVSGKGLGAFPGLSMVFYNHPVAPSPRRLPRYMDLGLYAANDGIPFTHSSNLLYALQAAVKQLSSRKSFEDLEGLSTWLRGRLREEGFRMIGDEAHLSPAVITIELPRGVRSEDVGLLLEEAGFLLSYRSSYLLKRNWIQICFMGECSRDEVEPLLNVLKSCCRMGPAPA